MASITEPSSDANYLLMAPKDEAAFPDLTMTATAKATNGEIVQMDFYDGNTLIESLTDAPYTTTLTAPATGKHGIRVVATDSNGKKAEASCEVNYAVSQGTYTFNKFFKEGLVPQGWHLCTGSTKRAGGSITYTDGPRILRFTNNTRGFGYGILVQNATIRAKAAWAKYGDNDANSHLTLHAGHYVVKYKLCNWNQPNFRPVTVAIEKANGEEVVSQTYTPTVNIGGNTANMFTDVTQQILEFDIPETGDYVIAFYTDAARNSDFVLGQLSIQPKEFSVVGIKDIDVSQTYDSPSGKNECFDLSGRRIVNHRLSPGLYIIDGRKMVIR